MPVVNPVVRRPLIRPSLGLTSHLSSGRFYTNLLLQSINQNNASWNATNVTRARDATSPNGVANTATTLTDTAINNAHNLNQSMTLASGTIITYSCWAKRGVGSRNFALMIRGTSGANYFRQFYDLNAGTIGTPLVVGDAKVYTSGIKLMGNGFYRCWVTGYHSSSEASNLCRLEMISGASTDVYLGDGSTIIVWGSQLQTGFVPTNLIQTTTAVLTQEETDNVYGN